MWYFLFCVLSKLWLLGDVWVEWGHEKCVQNFDSEILGKLTLWSPRVRWECESKMDLRTFVRETCWIELANDFVCGFLGYDTVWSWRLLVFRSNILILHFQNIVFILKMEEGGCPRTLVTNHSPDYTVLVNLNNQHLNHGRRGVLRSLIIDNFSNIWDVILAMLDLHVTL